MAISKVKLPDNTVQDIKDARMGNARIFHGTCSTAAATTAKVVTCNDFTSGELVKGALIYVTFDYTNSGAVADITLDVNNTGARSIKKETSTSSGGSTANLQVASQLQANNTYLFQYNGTYWVCMTMDHNTNTTYSSMTVAEIDDGTGTTARLITPARLKYAIETWAPEGTQNFIIPVVASRSGDNISYSTTVTYTELFAAYTANKRIIAKIDGAWAGDVEVNYVYYVDYAPSDTYFVALFTDSDEGIHPQTFVFFNDNNDAVGITHSFPDNSPTQYSYNVITSGGVYDALATKYEKPSTGIPASDLESGVIPTTLPASDVYAWAKQSTKPTYTASEVGALPDTTVIPTVPTISTNVVSDKTSNTKTSSPKSVYDEIHPAVVTTQPSGGFVPNILYNLGTLTGSKAFTLASPSDNTIVNHYYWTFTAGSTAPTITWPAGVSWFGGSAPTITAGKHYDVSILDNIAVCMEV